MSGIDIPIPPPDAALDAAAAADQTILGMDPCSAVTAVTEATKDCYYLAHRPTEEVVLSLCDYLDIDWEKAEDDVAHMEKIVEMQDDCPPEIAVFDEHFQNLLATIFSHIADFMERRGQDPEAPCVILGGLVSENTVGDIMSAARLSLATYHRQSQPLSSGSTLQEIIAQRRSDERKKVRRGRKAGLKSKPGIVVSPPDAPMKPNLHVDPHAEASEDPFSPQPFDPSVDGMADNSPRAPAVLRAREPNRVGRDRVVDIRIEDPEHCEMLSPNHTPSTTPSSSRKRLQQQDPSRRMSSVAVLSPDESRRLEALRARMGKRQSVAGPDVEMMLKGALAGDDGRTEEQKEQMHASKRRKASRVIRSEGESPGLDPLESTRSHTTTPRSPALEAAKQKNQAATNSAELRAHLQAFRLGSEPSESASEDDQTLSQSMASLCEPTPRRRLPSSAAAVHAPSDLEQRLKTLSTLQYLDLILQTLSALVTLVYEEQLRELTIEGETSGVSRLAEWCAARIIDELAEEDIDPQLPLDLQLLHVIQGIAFEDDAFHYRRLNPMDMEVLQTVWGVVLPPDVSSSCVATKDPTRQWYEWGVLSKPGFRTYQGSYYTSARLNPFDYKYRRCLKGLPEGLNLKSVNPTAELPRPSFISTRPGENLCSIPIPVDGADGNPVALLTLSAPPEGSTHRGSNRAKPHIKPTNPRAFRELERKYKQKRKRNRLEQQARDEKERLAREAGESPPPPSEGDSLISDVESGVDETPEDPALRSGRSPPPVTMTSPTRAAPVGGTVSPTPPEVLQDAPPPAEKPPARRPSPPSPLPPAESTPPPPLPPPASDTGSTKRDRRERRGRDRADTDVASTAETKALPGPPRTRKDQKEKCCIVS